MPVPERVQERMRDGLVGFVDESTPTKKAKPPGVIGAEIWLALLPVGTPAPTDPADYDFVALDTKTPYTLDPGHEYASRAGFDGADGGKNAHYLLRWANATGERGPWSETVSVTVGA